MSAETATRRLSWVRDAATGLIIALVGALALWATSDFASGLPPASDPALLPRAVGFGLIALGVGIAATGIIGRRGTDHSDEAEGIPIDIEVPEELVDTADDADGKPDWWVVGGLVAACMAYSWAAFRVGFITATFTFLVLTSLLLGRPRSARTWVIMLTFSAAITLAAHVIFFVLLNTRPPLTPLP